MEAWNFLLARFQPCGNPTFWKVRSPKMQGWRIKGGSIGWIPKVDPKFQPDASEAGTLLS
jgi:hypothetical protein